MSSRWLSGANPPTGGLRSRSVGNGYPSAQDAIAAAASASTHSPQRAALAQYRINRLAHTSTVKHFHRAAICGRDLQEIRHALNVRGAIGTRRMKQRRIKKHGIALREWQLDEVLLEVFAEVRTPPCQISLGIAL